MVTLSEMQNLQTNSVKSTKHFLGGKTKRRITPRRNRTKFFYDNLHRLDYSNLNSVQNLDVAYDAMGNITKKTDVHATATWVYHSTKKHAVITAGSNSFTYDNNGNQITRNGQSVTWTSYNYPSHVPNGTKYHDFFYDGNRQRWKQVYYNGSSSETTIFVGGILEKNTAGSLTEYRHYIQAGGQPVALYTRPSTGAITTQYFLLDHLGSVAEITNSTGIVDLSESFAAFGGRRDPTDWSGPPTLGDEGLIAGATPRGFTFHTNLDSSPLIHMNGRVMDSLTGRFLSPDPYITAPHLTQAYNRFSYVNNNPLTYTDMSGFCIDGASTAACINVIRSIVGTIASFAKKLFGKSPPPPPNYCFIAGPTGCNGSAPSKFKTMLDDIFGLPNSKLGSWGVGEDRFGTGTCSFSPICMSLGEEISDIPLEELEKILYPTARDKAIAQLVEHIKGLRRMHNEDKKTSALRGRFSSEYRGYDIGAHVYEGTSIFRSNNYDDMYSFGKVDIWPAFNASPGGAGLFANLTGAADRDSIALVIALAPTVSIEELINRQGVYMNWSKALNKAIYVISNDNDQVFEFINGNARFWPPRMSMEDN